MTSKRYEIASKWEPVDLSIVQWYPFGAEGDPDDRCRTTHIGRDVADLRDTRDGHVYTNGAYRVVLSGTRPPGFSIRGKTFHGESAWYAAENHRDAMVREMRRLEGAHAIEIV